MINLGTDDPRVAAHLDRAVQIITGPVDELFGDLTAHSTLPDDCELTRLARATGPGPVDIITSLGTAATAAHNSLQQIAAFITTPAPTWPVVLQSLTRTALIATARICYVLLPQDPTTRVQRANAVLAQDTNSGIRALKHYTRFDGLAGIRAPQALLNAYTDQNQRLREHTPSPRDIDIIDGMSTALADALTLATPHASPDDLAALHDHGTWLWNTYSGLAHAYTWPQSLWHLSPDPRIPGDYPMDLHHTATCTHIALASLHHHANPTTTATTHPIHLDTT